MNNRTALFLAVIAFIVSSCGPSARIHKAAKRFYADSALAGAHVGLTVYDPSSRKVIYDHNGDSYFVPASNTKIFTCYAALKYLGDSLAGIRYNETDTAVFIFPTGDPGFLHPDFKSQPVADFLRHQSKPVYLVNNAWRTTALGSGWQWDDYNDEYSAERSALPVYGNCIRWFQEQSGKASNDSMEFDQSVFIYSVPEVDMPVRFDPAPNSKAFKVTRDLRENSFYVEQGSEQNAKQDVPYITYGVETGIRLLKDSIQTSIAIRDSLAGVKPIHTIASRPVDSVLIPMMHRSDNFFAEQLLLMVSEKLTGVFDEQALIDSLLRTELTGMPGTPHWVDGSGLSRYNLFSPKEFIYILGKMQSEFSLKKLATIFPVAGSGTLKTFDAGVNKVIAKTGSMSGVVALSGFVVRPSGKTMLFSFLVNNHRGTAAGIRRKMGEVLRSIK